MFAAGLEWAIEAGAGIINLSLSSRSEALFGVFHDLADRAYFAGVLLVCAANNVAVASYPSLFAAVVSVAAHDVRDPGVWFYNPKPPVEFGAYGLDVDVAWKGGGRIVGDRQQLRGAAHRRLCRPDPGGAPRGQPVRGQDDPRRDRRRGLTPAETAKHPAGGDGGVSVCGRPEC